MTRSRLIVLVLLPLLGAPAAAHDETDPASAVRFFTDRTALDLPLPEEDDAFVFGIFGDRTGGPAAGVEVLREAVGDINLLDPDLVMTVGDLIEGYNERPRWMEQMREYTSIMDGLDAPWFPVAGNHDIYWRGEGPAPEGEHEAAYEMHFGPLWYAFEHKDCWFIVLYSDEGDPATGRKSFNDPVSQRMSDGQLAWLDSALERAADARHVFVFLHHPRWLGGGYGDDWGERVHPRLAAAGNVTAVFAGHIHRMRHDGVQDGIEYVALATTGGWQDGHAPEAGYLHHYHVVTVRDEGISMAALPVGTVMDVRSITGETSDDVARIARRAPGLASTVGIDSSGRAAGRVTATWRNPARRPVELTLVPESADPRWRAAPDHVHRVVEPDERIEIAFELRRPTSEADASLDEAFALPRLRIERDYLADGARFAMPAHLIDIDVAADLPPTDDSIANGAMRLDGSDDVAILAAAQFDLPQGPLTVECRLNGDDYRGRRGLLCKTENSEYGIFVSNGRPAFHVFLDGGYVTAEAPDAVLERGRWHHVAGVFDGSEVRLYVDGELVARAAGRGVRRTNSFPFVVGADVDGAGRPTSHFDGRLDEVRVSTVARYAGERFTPRMRHETDEATALLLHLDEAAWAWARNAAGEPHPILRGRPVFSPLD